MAIIVNKDEKKRQIALSSIDVFIESGLNKTSVEKIAKYVGVGKGTIYNYFNSKEEIIVEIWDYISELHINYIENSVKNKKSAKEKIVSYFEFDKIIEPLLFEKIFCLYQEYLGAIVVANVNTTLLNDFKKHYEMEYNYLSQFLKDGVENGEFKNINTHETTKSLISMTKGLIIDTKYHNYEEKVPLEELKVNIDNFLELIKKD